MLHASQLAACVDMHPYQPVSEAFEKVWKRTYPESFSAAYARNDKKTDDLILRDFIATSPAARGLIASAETPRETAGAVARNLVNTTDMVADLPTDAATKKLVRDQLRKSCYTSYGIARESAVLEKLRAELVFGLKTDDSFKCADFPGDSGTVVRIGGRLDAMSDDGAVVVEIKNRVNRLFGKVVEYENVQIQAYIRIIGAESGLLVENITLPDGSMSTATHFVPKDDDLWARVVNRAGKFMECLRGVDTDPDEADAYVVSKKKNAFIRLRIS